MDDCWIVPIDAGGVRNTNNWRSGVPHCGPFNLDPQYQTAGPVMPREFTRRPRASSHPSPFLDPWHVALPWTVWHAAATASVLAPRRPAAKRATKRPAAKRATKRPAAKRPAKRPTKRPTKRPAKRPAKRR